MKLRNRNSILPFVALLIAAWSAHAAEKFVWTKGHGDLAVNYANGRWIWYAEEGREVDQVIIRLNEVTRLQIPADPAFSFLGAAGEPVWVIPAGEAAGIPFMGINSEAATRSGTFANDRFDLHLSSVSGPGDFIMWTTSGTGMPTILMNSRDGITAADKTDVPAPGHFHQNWGFSSPGTYRIGYKASGVLTGQNTPITSDEVVYTYEVNVLKQGEADIEVAYEGGELEFHVHDEGADVEFDPAHIALQAKPATWQTVPESAAFAFLGTPGTSLYVLPQEETEGVLFLGLAAAEVEQGVFANNKLSINLVSATGPGRVFYYEVDGFGAPTVFFNSANGIDAADLVTVDAGSHAHRNWGFTAPGVYRVTLQAKGTLASGGTAVSSPPATFLFEALPPTIIEQGEIDFEVAYEGGQLEMGLLDEAADREFATGDVVLVARAAALQSVPSNPAFSFLGAGGATVHILPQDETEGLLFIGIAGDEIEAGLFAGESVQLELVSATGPGEFALYAVDNFSIPKVMMNTRDGVSAADVFRIPVGSHTHLNWAFSQAGEYRLQFRAAGTLVAGNKTVQSEPVTLAFKIETSGPRLTARLINNGKQLQIGWESRSGVSYQLRSRTALGAGNWSNEGLPMVGNGGPRTVTVEIGSELLKVFHLVDVQP